MLKEPGYIELTDVIEEGTKRRGFFLCRISYLFNKLRIAILQFLYKRLQSLTSEHFIVSAPFISNTDLINQLHFDMLLAGIGKDTIQARAIIAKCVREVGETDLRHSVKCLQRSLARPVGGEDAVVSKAKVVIRTDPEIWKKKGQEKDAETNDSHKEY